MKQFSIPKITNFDNWDDINELSDFSYSWEKEKAPLTKFSAYYDQSHFYFRFVAVGPGPLVFVDKNDKLEVLNSERVELFFRSNEKMEPYYCLEIDSYGRVLDYKANLYRQFDRDWEWPESLYVQTIIEDERYVVKGKISLSVLRYLNLIDKNEIQVGLFRGHCVELEKGRSSLKWINWVNSKTQDPDFHVPSSFGILKLE